MPATKRWTATMVEGGYQNRGSSGSGGGGGGGRRITNETPSISGPKVRHYPEKAGLGEGVVEGMTERERGTEYERDKGIYKRGET